MNETPKTKRGWTILRRILITLAVLATLVAAFYAEEDWRGKRAWESCRRELEAQGVVFDWKTRIPPPVPDEQNIFKAPKMTEWFVGRGTNDLFERLANPKSGMLNSGGYTNAIQTEADARDYLAWSDQFSADFDLIRAALKRPCARIDCDYSRPMTVLAPNFLTVRIVVQTLAQRTHCFLLLGEPDKALQELTLLHNFCRILEGAPSGKPITLIAAMINVAVVGLYADTIAESLRMHAWREPQLSTLEQQLGEIDLAPFIAETFIDEPMFTLRTLETSPRMELVKLVGPDVPKKSKLLLKYVPRGWLYQYMVIHARLNQKFSAGFDAANQMVSPGKIDDAGRILQHNIDHSSPYDFMASWWTPNWGKALQRFAQNQTYANEAAVACGLERYRLAHGEYPETLDTLMPQFIEKIPHDIINRQSLHYRRTDDGKFLLYSVGWNETDDGGQDTLLQKNSWDYIQGDWVWKN